MTEVRADQPAMEQFAATSLDRRDEFDHLRSTMDGQRVPRDAFGYIPGIGNRVHSAYDEFVSGCADALASAAETMASIAAAVRGAATAYHDTDAGSAAALSAIESGMTGTGVRPVK